MNSDSMSNSVDAAQGLIAGLIEENRATILRDMGDSFVQQAKEDESKKLTCTVTVSIKFTPNGEGVDVDAAVKNGIKRKATASIQVG